jgi:uncharacterized YccA/Bax inhibitor family protein
MSSTIAPLQRHVDQALTSQKQPSRDSAEAHAEVTASDNPMTYESTINKTAFLLIVVIATAAVGWFIPALVIPGALAGLALGFVNVFKKQPSPLLITLYAAAEGLFLGGISGVLNAQWAGIVSQAVLGTLMVFGVTLLLFRSGKIRTSPRLTKVVMTMAIGYLAFSLVNLALMLTGVTSDPWGLRGVQVFGIPLGVGIGLLAIALAAYFLVMDFENIQNGVRRKVDDRYAWSAAFGLLVTLIWLYVEILRLLALLRGNN